MCTRHYYSFYFMNTLIINAACKRTAKSIVYPTDTLKINEFKPLKPHAFWELWNYIIYKVFHWGSTMSLFQWTYKTPRITKELVVTTHSIFLNVCKISKFGSVKRKDKRQTQVIFPTVILCLDDYTTIIFLINSSIIIVLYYSCFVLRGINEWNWIELPSGW